VNHPLRPDACPHDCGNPCHSPAKIREHFSRQIKLWREAHQWSIDCLARQIGVSASTISLWESSKRFPSLENIAALARLMKQPVSLFFCPGSNRENVIPRE
jgi:transcriptional regulator with XRE-family HTH domain